MSFLHPFAGWMTCALPATQAASAERLSGQGQRCLRLIRYQWLGSFGNRGNGLYRTELRQGLAAIRQYLTAYQLPQEQTLLRLDGQYGNGAVLTDLAGFAFVTRGKDYRLLDHPLVQARLHLPPDQLQQRPESQMVRSLYDCSQTPVGPDGVPCRVIVATHPSLGRKRVRLG